MIQAIFNGVICGVLFVCLRSLKITHGILKQHEMVLNAVMKQQVNQLRRMLGEEDFQKLHEEAMNKMVDEFPPDIDETIKQILRKRGKDGLGKN